MKNDSRGMGFKRSIFLPRGLKSRPFSQDGIPLEKIFVRDQGAEEGARLVCRFWEPRALVREGFIFLICLFLSGQAQAQSMLEYSALTTATTTAAAKAKKGKVQDQDQGESQALSGENGGFVEGAMTTLHEENSQMMSSKGVSLLGQAGRPSQMSVADAPEVNKPPIENLSMEPMPVSTTNADVGSAVTLRLNSGQLVKGTLVDQNKDYVKIDIAGVTTTYFTEEVSRIE